MSERPPAGAAGRPRAGASVALDYTAAAGHAPGVGRYVRELVRALVREPGPALARLRLVEVGRAPRPMAGAPLGLEGPEVVRPVEHRRLRLPRRLLALGARLGVGPHRNLDGGCDLFHHAAPGPLAGWLPSGARVRTAAVAELPALGGDAAEAFGEEARAAAGLLVFSEAAAIALSRDHGVDASRIHRVPVGTDHWERDLPEGLPRREPRDVLVLGSIRRSREPLAALRAFEALGEGAGSARLLFVGRPGDAAGELRAALRASPAAGRVLWIEAPEEARMPGAVAGSSVLLHLAHREATPVTPLEAARHGLGVVASPLPAFQEALGEHARYVDARDPAAVASALRDALEESADDAARARMRRVAAPYTWQACARAHLDAWETILGRP